VRGAGLPRHDQTDTLTQEQQILVQAEGKESSKRDIEARIKVIGEVDFKFK
jgi:hypothetical protein